jgi:glycosyltransferase involved in cell wall biosynthesis
MRKNVLIIANDSSLYGANQSLINMISSIRNEDICLTVVFPDHGLICNKFDELGWGYHIIKFRSELCGPKGGIKNYILNLIRYLYKIFTNFLAFYKLSSFVELNNINIIHSNSSVISIGEYLSNKLNIRHIWHLREFIDPDHNMNILGDLNKYKIRIQNSDKILCITKRIANHFEVQDKALILHDAVRKQGRYKPSRRRSNYFLFCGALVKNKGVEEAIQSFCRVFSLHHDLRLLIVGSGELNYENYIKNKVIELKMQNNVEFLGFRNDIDELMANALAFLMCSKNEALGRVTIEAMLNYCVVLGYNDGGTSEIINHGTTGFLYENIDQLVGYMNDIVTDKEINFDTIRRNAYEFACANFLEEQFGKRLIEYYNSFD